ncbi:MAG: GAF domain-containing protein, partial [Candidatus Angelobacter sp.]
YRAGSELVKSEMMTPVFVQKKLFAVIDINSYFVNTFSKEEQEFIEGCAALVSSYVEKPR